MSPMTSRLLALALSSAAAWSIQGRLPAAPRATSHFSVAAHRSEALQGGRPSSALRINSSAFARLIRGAAKYAEFDASSVSDARAPDPWARAWLELANGETVVVSFERTRDDTNETCTMRVRQSRLTAECSVDNPAACNDVGCVAVRWNFLTREGVLVDLFKASKGLRTYCDLSSADNPRVKWGQLMLRVVDDIAAMLGMRHVYLADESSTRLTVWDARTSGAQTVQVMQKYLLPLLYGVSYYDRFGYYTIPAAEYYNGPNSSLSRPDEDDRVRVRTAQEHAAAAMTAFNDLRTAPFRECRLAAELARVGDGETASRDGTIIHRFALAVAAAQEVPPSERIATFRASASELCGTRGGCDVPHQFWIHSRTAVTSDATFEEFVARHETALDMELLSAAHIGDVIRILYDRNRADTSTRALKAGALLLELMFDLWAVWSPRRCTPLKRKDYYEHGSLASATHIPWQRERTQPTESDTESPQGVDSDGAPITIGAAPREQLIRASFYICDAENEEGVCELPV